MFSRLLGLNTWLQRTCSTKGVNFINNFNIFWGHRQLFKLDGLHPNKLGARVLKDNIYFSLRHPSVVCANPLGLNSTHTPGQSMSDHRTSCQPQSHHVVDTSLKDIDNDMQPKQAFLMETIPAEPCPQSSSQTDCDVLQSSKTQHPRTTFWKTAREARTTYHSHRKHQSPSHQTHYPLSSISTSKLVYAGTNLSHSFAASPQISTKKRRAPQPPKTAGPALPPPVRAL